MFMYVYTWINEEEIGLASARSFNASLPGISLKPSIKSTKIVKQRGHIIILSLEKSLHLKSTPMQFLKCTTRGVNKPNHICIPRSG